MELADIRLRPAQMEILQYRKGLMGVSAVPGSGKTWTLSLLAAQLVISGNLQDDQEVLVVTLVNSAVDNFYRRVSGFVKRGGLLPFLGYRVRTLHGLAHDIVRERPDLALLDHQFSIVDEREANEILRDAVRAWLRSHPNGLDDYMDPEMDDSRLDWIRRERLPKEITEVALAVIRSAKNKRLRPEQLRRQLDALPLPLSLAAMGSEIYTDYQRGLDYRGAVDFDDLIRLAIQVLEGDPGYLERLRQRWPYILEDEAQDSSSLQEQILSMLAGPDGNWVRVGDPNQAIYETFTTANPRFLIDFMKRSDVQTRTLPNSGRSTISIITFANHLVTWTQTEHPSEAARNALVSPPFIEPTPPGDPQPNPTDNPGRIHISSQRLTPQDEIGLIADSLERWLPDHPESTVAVLAPRNKRGFEMADELNKRGLPYEDGLLQSSSTTRFSAGVLGNLLNYLADPDSGRKLAIVYQVWKRRERQEGRPSAEVAQVSSLLRKLDRVEDFLWPEAHADWLLELRNSGYPEAILDSLEQFRLLVRRWQSAILLPIDQMALTLAQDLLTEPAELAIGHKLAVLLRQVGQAHPDWRLPELSQELGVIARNERRFIGFSEDETGFDPDHHKGKVVVATMHKAKGLEWDRVYLMSVNNYDFPSGLEGDQFIAERSFVRNQLNLQAEALAQLEAAFQPDEFSWYLEGDASAASRLDYVRERLRLLYVGITRARKELIITWNTGRDGNLRPAVPLVALQNFLNQFGTDSSEGSDP